MKKINILFMMFLVAGINACDKDELYEREQYKKVFALLSDDGDNIFAEEIDLKPDEATGWVVASVGGSLPTESAIGITMVVDEDVLDRFNKRNFDVEYEKYARLLSTDNYLIEKFDITIPAGERIGKMKIRLNAHGLSPDSTYFIPLRADHFTAYELKPSKSDVLYRVLLKNFYATQKTTTNYNLRGKLDNANLMSIKQVFPVSGNKVRCMAGNISFEPNVALINAASIVLEVDDDNKVYITPWKTSDGISVTQVEGDPDFPNIFKIENTGYKTYKTFLLRYNYEYEGKTHEMWEELRLEFDKNKDN
ncbi:hypothetical protein FACS1894121_1150 [Bacteroidia bacterium]|nr:hypothetical protein FACS1894121_1150 [Bacteroidia bacterium]